MRCQVKITFNFLFQKGKKKKWKTLIKYTEYKETFANLGKHEVLQEEIFRELEISVSKIYEFKSSTLANDEKKGTFLSKYEKEEKSFDLCILPPCQENLKVHIRILNYIATIFRCRNGMRILNLYGVILIFQMTFCKCCLKWMKIN